MGRRRAREWETREDEDGEKEKVEEEKPTYSGPSSCLLRSRPSEGRQY